MVYKITNQNNLKTPTLGESNIFAPEEWMGWKTYFPFGARPIFRGELLVLERVNLVSDFNHFSGVVFSCCKGTTFALYTLFGRIVSHAFSKTF